ncbi:HNH endonuclease [Pseudomonas sp. R2.Fl]|nr:HNH endonuclease [Pseudomonas sp. R2.Fl]
MNIPEFQQNRFYKRSAIHDEFGGSRQSGISPSRKVPAVFIFTGKSGEQYGYTDLWDASQQVFTYTGEGQLDDMTMDSGNAAIRNHVEDGRSLHLFEIVSDKDLEKEVPSAEGRGYVRYVGEMQCAGVIEGIGPDRKDNLRKIFQFQLVRVDALEEAEEVQLMASKQATSAAGTVNLSELRSKALQAVRSEERPPRDAKRTLYERAKHVVDYALARARGTCEACGSPAPFARPSGEAYLEVHHIDRLSDGGLDVPHRVASICPTCHRRIHCGQGGQAFNDELRLKIEGLEAALSKTQA